MQLSLHSLRNNKGSVLKKNGSIAQLVQSIPTTVGIVSGSNYQNNKTEA